MSDDTKQAPEPVEISQEDVAVAEAAETQALKELSNDEAQTQVIEEYGLDIEADSELIGKLVTSKQKEYKTVGVLIKQKQNLRAETVKPAEVKPDPEAAPTGPTGPAPLTHETLNERLDERELDATDLSDELKTEVKTYAKINNCSIRAAQDSTYIKFLLEEETKKARTEEAGIGDAKQTQPTVSNFAEKSFGDFDLTTEEGRKAWDDYKVWLKDHPDG